MYLVDTNVWLELLLDQEKARDVRQFFEKTEAHLLAITEFSLYSIGIVLTRFNKDSLFADFLSDTLEDSGVACIRLTPVHLKRLLERRASFNLDFDDAYQYVAAETHHLTLVSFDADFDQTERGRKAPKELLQNR